MQTYINPFFQPLNQYSKREYPADPNAIEYRGYTIHKVSAIEYHVVNDGVCVSMRGSVDNCKKFIDSLNSLKTT